jgi:hypothetical protein
MGLCPNGTQRSLFAAYFCDETGRAGGVLSFRRPHFRPVILDPDTGEVVSS